MPSATARIAARIAEIRAQRGLTQESLAARARFNRVTLARHERALHPPNLDTLERIARALGEGLVDLVKYARSVAREQARLIKVLTHQLGGGAAFGLDPVRAVRLTPLRRGR